MVSKNIQRDRVFARDHAIHQRARAAGAEVDDHLLLELLEVARRMVLAPGQSQVGEKQGCTSLACVVSSPTPVPSTTSATTLFARTSAEIFCAISSESARQWDSLMNGYFLLNFSASG